MQETYIMSGKKLSFELTPKEKAVWEICDDFYQHGQRITYQSVAKALIQNGQKRGSNSDLCRFINSWKDNKKTSTPQRPTTTETAPTPPQPGTPSNRIESYYQTIWDQADHAIEEIQQNAFDTIALLEQQKAELNEALCLKEQEMNEMSKELARMKKPSHPGPLGFEDRLFEQANSMGDLKALDYLKLYEHHHQQCQRYIHIIQKNRLRIEKLTHMITQLKKQLIKKSTSPSIFKPSIHDPW